MTQAEWQNLKPGELITDGEIVAKVLDYKPGDPVPPDSMRTYRESRWEKVAATELSENSEDVI